MEKVKRFAKGFLMVVGGIYLVTVMLALPYFNWNYAREHGFWNWLLLGEFMVTLKAPIWPLYVSIASERTTATSEDWTEEEKRGAIHFVQSLEAFDKSGKALRDALDGSGEPSDRLKAGLEKGKSLLESALYEARLVNDAALLKIHPELKGHFNNEFLQSLEIELDNSGDIKARTNRHMSAASLGNAWGIWFIAHSGRFAKIPSKWFQENR